MGLDMYLSAKKYLPSSDVFGKDRHIMFMKVADAIDAKPMGDFESIEVKVSAAYWRKANHIHRWFVENVQGGEDNCASYYVSHDKLEELYNLCYSIQQNKDAAAELLPTVSGFFFGGTEYDEWYYENVNKTAEQVQAAINNFPNGWDFYYESSW